MAKMATAMAQLGMQNEMGGTKRVKGDANSTVKTYFITGAELDRYRAMPAPSVEKNEHTKAKIW